MSYYSGRVIGNLAWPWEYIFAALTVVWLCVMTWLSHQNGEKTAETSGWLAVEISQFFPRADEGRLNSELRKAAHIVVFGVLTALLLATLDAWGINLSWTLLTAVWAVGDEWTKRFVPGRHFSWQDVGLNGLGVIIGAGIGLVVAMS